MLRPLLLIVPPCLAVLACSAPPPTASGLTLRAPPQDADRPTASSSEGWTTGVYGTQQTGTTARDERYDDDHNDLDEQHITILVGERWLDNDWEPVDEQLAGGLEYDAYDHDSGNGFEVGAIYSQDDDKQGGFDVDANTMEGYAGFRHTFNPEDDHHEARHDTNGDGVIDDRDARGGTDDDDDVDVRPYLAGGLAVIRAEVDPDPGSSDDDTSPGAYLRAGLAFDLGERTRLGLDYRHMFLTDIDIGGLDNVDYDQLMLTLGFAF